MRYSAPDWSTADWIEFVALKPEWCSFCEGDIFTGEHYLWRDDGESVWQGHLACAEASENEQPVVKRVIGGVGTIIVFEDDLPAMNGR